MSWVWWAVALWVPVAVTLALAVSRSIRIADRCDLGIRSGSRPDDERSTDPASRSPSEPV